jgi:hypothetical protein
VIEVKSVVPDVQATLVTLDRKERLAPEIARTRGWDAAVVAKLLVVRNDRTSRRRIEVHAATFGNAFPDRSPDPDVARRAGSPPTPARPVVPVKRISHDRKTARPGSLTPARAWPGPKFVTGESPAVG